MRSTLTMPIGKEAVANDLVEKYLSILLDYVEQLPTIGV